MFTSSAFLGYAQTILFTLIRYGLTGLDIAAVWYLNMRKKSPNFWFNQMNKPGSNEWRNI